MRVQILVRLKSGVLDVQGKAVEHGLASIGFSGVEEVRVGKLIEFVHPGTSEVEVRAHVEQMCEKLLINPVIENFEIKIEAA